MNRIKKIEQTNNNYNNEIRRGRGFESHSGQLSIWNRKILAQNEYHIYRQIPPQTPMINSIIKVRTLVWRLMTGLARN